MRELPVQSSKTSKLSQMRWAMCVAYYIPPVMAALLIDVVDNTQKMKLFKTLDAFLEPFTKYFLWPPAFGDQGGQSLCFTHNKDLGTDLYCSARMHDVAASMRQPLSPPGCSTVALLDWRILQSTELLQ